MHSRARPTASAARITRARSTSVRRAPGSTVAGAPSRVTRAVRRVGSMLGGVSTETPSPISTTATSSPAATRSSCARPPPRTAPADPVAVSPSTVTAPPRATAPATEPSARPGRWVLAISPPTAASVALAITVGTNGPGATARPSASTTTTSSSRPYPDPPCSSGTCSPSQPNPTRSSQNGGRASSGASSSARAAPRASRRVRKSEAVPARARWSSVMAIDMAAPYVPWSRSCW